MLNSKREDMEMFLRNIDNLDIAHKAALKRAFGTPLSTAGVHAKVTFYHCLPYDLGDHTTAEKWFMVACARCRLGRESSGSTPLEQVIRQMNVNETLSPTTMRNVEILIGSRWDTSGWTMKKFCGLIKRLEGEENCCFDYVCLLEDLERWDDRSCRIKERWAKAIFGFGAGTGFTD